ncbi:MAG: hypothetical protein WD076_01700 [Parvularculaceae bacterium]
MNKRRAATAGFLSLCLATAACFVAPSALTPAAAQQPTCTPKPQERRPSDTLDLAVARELQIIFEQMTAEQYPIALTGLNQLLASRGEKMKPFDRATTLELRGSVKAQLEDYRGALRDFEDALKTGALPQERNNQLRYFIAQLYFQLEDYQSAIRGLQEWIRIAQADCLKVDPNAYYLLAAAYIQSQPPNYRAALPPAEQALALSPEPRKSIYDLLNLVYSELNENTKRAALLEKMINFWPSERNYWTQLSGLYNQLGKDSDAFAVLEVAYRAGLLKTESEILTLVQYFSFYDNPYRGAKLLERELQSGAVKRTVRNLTLLSQLLSQAREHKRAIPILEEASRQSGTGELAYRLGQVLLADEQYVASERALRNALNKGGMKAEQTGDCWLLLGTAIFSQAGPGDRAVRCRGREAFVRARNYQNTSRQASQWVQYIDAINSTEDSQDLLEWEQRQEARQSDIERLRTTAQVCRLQGGGAECDPILAQIKELESINDPRPKVGLGCERAGAAAGGGSSESTESAPATPPEATQEPDAAETPPNPQ